MCAYWAVDTQLWANKKKKKKKKKRPLAGLFSGATVDRVIPESAL